ARALAGLNRIDERTFTVSLLQPFSDFPALLANPAFHPLPSAAWQSPGVLRPGFQDAPIGNGPFRLRAARQRGEHIEVQRYDTYPGAKPQVAGVQFRVYRHLGSAYADVVRDRLDVVSAIPGPRLAAAGDELAGRVHAAAGSVVQFLAFPMTGGTFGDARVRRAVSMAIDRDALVRTVFGAAEEPARSFVPPVVPGYRPDGCGPGCRFDPAAARRLYTGASGPARLEIAYNSDGDHRAWVDVLCGQLTANLGVACAGAPQPTFADLLAGVRGGRLTGLYRVSWDLDYPSMENGLRPLFSSTGAANDIGYRNPEFDESVRRGATARGGPDAVAQYQRAEDLLAADMPAIPVRFSRTHLGYRAVVGNLRTDRGARIDLTAVTKSG
ncbi:MAG TPA: ABC transporter substrate-binding protein, partial [Catenuloplanes sp.]